MGSLYLLNVFILAFEVLNEDSVLAGIIGVSSMDTKSNAKVVYVLAHSMRMLQHRGKAYWKISSNDKFIDGQGSLPTDDNLLSLLGSKSCQVILD